MTFRVEKIGAVRGGARGRAVVSRSILRHRAVLWRSTGSDTVRAVALLHPLEEAGPCPVYAAARLYQKWNEFPPGSVRLERRHVSRIMVDLGRVVALTYESKKWTGRPALYVHRFGRGARLRADPGNPGFLVIRGPFRVRAAGIVG